MFTIVSISGRKLVRNCVLKVVVMRDYDGVHNRKWLLLRRIMTMFTIVSISGRKLVRNCLLLRRITTMFTIVSISGRKLVRNWRSLDRPIGDVVMSRLTNEERGDVLNKLETENSRAGLVITFSSG